MIEFKDSESENVSKTLLVAVAGATGSGKTESGLRIATGIAGDNFSVIDSENKRALNKKSRYKFKHFDMQPPYSPAAYRAVIEASIKAGHRAIVIDSFSAEWDDEGGLHDMADIAIERLSKGDAQKAAALTGLAWKEPKMQHRALMRYLRKLEIPIIFCLRAEPKIKYIKDEKGKTQVVDAGWLPIAEKLFGYDMLVYCLMMPENPGIPVHLKKLEPEFEPMFPIGKQITEGAGRMLSEWAAGTTKKTAAPESESPPSRGRETPDAAAYITEKQAADLEALCTEVGLTIESLLNKTSAEKVSLIKAIHYAPAVNWINTKRK